MGFLGRSGHAGQPPLILINFSLRVCQFILAIATLGVYANEITVQEKLLHDGYHLSRTVTAIIVSCLSLVTAAVFGTVPIITADYFHVAVCFFWDFIIFCIWCTVFAYLHSIFHYSCGSITYVNGIIVDKTWCERNQATMWVDFVCLLLWLTTAILGIVGLVVSRRGQRSSPA